MCAHFTPNNHNTKISDIMVTILGMMGGKPQAEIVPKVMCEPLADFGRDMRYVLMATKKFLKVDSMGDIYTKITRQSFSKHWKKEV